MDISDFLVVILDTIEMSQALSIGIFLLFINRRKKNSLLYLGFFLTVSGLSSVSDIVDTYNLSISNESSKLLSINFFLLLPTLLYLYVEKVSMINTKRNSIFLLIPGVIELLVNIIIVFLPFHLKEITEESWIYGLFEMVCILSGLVIIGLTFKKIRKHSKLLRDQYSSLEKRELKWVYTAVLIIISMFIIVPIMAIFLPEYMLDVFDSTMSVVLIFWLSYNGLFQQISVNLIKENNIVEEDILYVENNKIPSQDTEKYSNVLIKIETVVKDEELFLNPDLTIVDISKRIDEHPRLVSSTINNLCKKNFNTYINEYRVERAKELLLSDKGARLNIEGIGIESGFKSNSSFYGAFKKYLNITPLQFSKIQKSA